jgi:hypothetical protein
MRARTFLPLLVTLVVAAAACEHDAPLEPAAGPTAEAAQPAGQGLGVPGEVTTGLYWFADGSVVEGARASLLRTSNALRTRTHTTGLPHRHVMTLWWVVFNNPEYCQDGEGEVACGLADLFDGEEGPTGVEPSCLYADGSIVGGNGQARFNNWLRVGDTRDSCIDFFVNAVPELEGQDYGLTNPEGAEVHLVVRSHGPLLTGQVPEQRGTFAGGCEEFLEPGQGPELEPGECSDLQLALFPAAD